MRTFRARVTRWIAIIAVIAVAVFIAITVDVRPTGWGGCALPTQGKYGALAVIDTRGFVHPFGGLNFDDGGDWKLVFRQRPGEEVVKVVSKDKFVMNTLKSLRFHCTGTDIATAEDILDVMKGDELVYSTAYFRTQGTFGFENQEFGYLPVTWVDLDLYRLTLDSLPNSLRGK